MDSPWHRPRMIRCSLQWRYEEDFGVQGMDAGFYDKWKASGAGQARCTLRRDPVIGSYENQVFLRPSAYAAEREGHFGLFGADGVWSQIRDLKLRAEANGGAHLIVDVTPYAEGLTLIVAGSLHFPVLRHGEIYDNGKLVSRGPWEDLVEVFSTHSSTIPLPLGPEFEVVLTQGAVSQVNGLKELTLRCTAVPDEEAVFRVLDDSDQTPLPGVPLLLRHPDGSEVEHVTDDAGEVGLPCCEGEEFVLVKLLPAPESRAPHFAVSWEVRDA